MIHQDGSTHEWVPGQSWDLIVTMDDVTSITSSGFFVEEEGTLSSLRGVRETIEAQGLFSSFYSDRGSHCWFIPKSGGQVEVRVLTQFGRAMSHLGIEMIPSYCPQGRGRSERFFATLQGRLPQEGVGGYHRHGQGQCLAHSREEATLSRRLRPQRPRRGLRSPLRGPAAGLASSPEGSPAGGPPKADNSCATKPDRSICYQHCADNRFQGVGAPASRDASHRASPPDR